MILGKEEILKAIENKRLLLEPFDANDINGSSIDLTLGNEFRIFTKDIESEDYEKYSKKVIQDEITLAPGDFILGITKEKITLDQLGGRLEGRSTYARLGIGIHVTSSFMHPGTSCKPTLEIKNVNTVSVTLKAGTKICQLILEEVKGKTVLQSKHNHQTEL